MACFTPMADAWYAELACRTPSTVTGAISARAGRPTGPLAARSVSRTRPTAPAPRSIPHRRLSKGSAASATLALVHAAPSARKPMPTQGKRCSELGLSADMMMTRRQRPERSQSQPSAMAAVVPAHAALMCRFGPRAWMISASCEFAITSSLNRSLRLNSYDPAVESVAASDAATCCWASHAESSDSRTTSSLAAPLLPPPLSAAAAAAACWPLTSCLSSSSHRRRESACALQSRAAIALASSSTSESSAGKLAAKTTPVSSRSSRASFHPADALADPVGALAGPVHPGQCTPVWLLGSRPSTSPA